jgi:hypothetical protein
MRALNTLLVSMILCISAATAPAQAQTTGVGSKVVDRLDAAVEQIKSACSADARTYCSNVTQGEGRLLFCMIAHEDKLSTKCDYAIYKASRNLDRALDRLAQTADACWTDIERHCADAPEGPGQIAKCLVVKRASLSTTCRDTMGQLGN